MTLRSWSVAVASLFALMLLTPGSRLDGGGKAGLKFEVYQDAAKEFRWRLKAANNEILATSGEGYKAKADAKRGVELIQEGVTKDSVKFELYEDKAKEHRWRAKAANGQIIGVSSEGYKAKADAENAVDLIKKGAAKAEVVEEKEKS